MLRRIRGEHSSRFPELLSHYVGEFAFAEFIVEFTRHRLSYNIKVFDVEETFWSASSGTEVTI